MEFPFDPKNMCKILAHECNNQNFGGTNCPAGAHYNCPFSDTCTDITWKDWKELLTREKKKADIQAKDKAIQNFR